MELSEIPQINKLLEHPDINFYKQKIGHAQVKTIIQDQIHQLKSQLLEQTVDITEEEIIQIVLLRCKQAQRKIIQRVINGSGVVLHTNLGRAPFSYELMGEMQQELFGYCNVEYDLQIKKRGKRGEFISELLCELTGAEDALVVNNNASTLFLILTTFAQNKEVIISRGEEVQIGGSFRIPDILRQSQAILKEIGTTNITTLQDYKNALTEDSRIIMKVHKSNYTIQGFTQEVTLKELAVLKSKSIILMEDLGSGSFVYQLGGHNILEPTVKDSISSGADLVTFSGDKLLGGPQAGVIVGKKEYIQQLRKSPLMRIIRVDKMVYYLLQKILLYYMNKQYDKIPVWRIIAQTKEDIDKNIKSFLSQLPTLSKDLTLETIEIMGRTGGGSLPEVDLPSKGIIISKKGCRVEEIFDHFIQFTPPILGIIQNQRFILDFRTIFTQDYPELVKCLQNL